MTEPEQNRLNPRIIKHQGLELFDHPSFKGQGLYRFDEDFTGKKISITHKEKGEFLRFAKKYGFKHQIKLLRELEWKRLITSLYAKAKGPYAYHNKNEEIEQPHKKCKGTGIIKSSCFDFRFRDSGRNYGFCRKMVDYGKTKGVIAIDYVTEHFCEDHKKIEQDCEICKRTGIIKTKKSPCKYLRATCYTDDPIDIIIHSKYSFKISEELLPKMKNNPAHNLEPFLILLAKQYNRKININFLDGYHYFTLKKEWEKVQKHDTKEKLIK